MRVAYADPPYIGQAKKHYDNVEVDHKMLITQLVSCYPDGWALSCSTPSLRFLLPLCPDDVRIAAWVKPFCIYKPNVNPAYAWEPVIWRGGRKQRARTEPTIRDWVSVNITLKKGLVGVKPPGFWQWLFALLGLTAADTFDDLYPGSGSGEEQWATYRALLSEEKQASES